MAQAWAAPTSPPVARGQTQAKDSNQGPHQQTCAPGEGPTPLYIHTPAGQSTRRAGQHLPVNSDTCCSISYQRVLRAAAAAIQGQAVLTWQLPPAHVMTPLLPAGCRAAVVHYNLHQHAAPRKLCTVHLLHARTHALCTVGPTHTTHASIATCTKRQAAVTETLYRTGMHTVGPTIRLLPQHCCCFTACTDLAVPHYMPHRPPKWRQHPHFQRAIKLVGGKSASTAGRQTCHSAAACAAATLNVGGKKHHWRHNTSCRGQRCSLP